MRSSAPSRSLTWITPVVVAQVALFAALTALSARVTIILPGTPVPLTLQVLAVLLSGTLLGARKGAASQIAYLLAIAAGAPVDARGLGAVALAGPTAGYLCGFVVAAFVAGWLRERLPRSRAYTFLAALAGVIGLYLLGTLWLAADLGAGLSVAWSLGGAPFLVADLAKALLCACLTIPRGPTALTPAKPAF